MRSLLSLLLGSTCTQALLLSNGLTENVTLEIELEPLLGAFEAAAAILVATYASKESCAVHQL
jgi:hypothetical protein